MLVIEPVTGNGCDEELGCVGVLTAVRHRQSARFSMRQGRIEFVLELAAPDRLTTCAVTLGTARLHHEAAQNSMEELVIVVAILSMRGEIFDSQWALMAIKLEVHLTHRCVDYSIAREHDLFCLLLLILLICQSVTEPLIHEVAPNFVKLSLTGLSA